MSTVPFITPSDRILKAVKATLLAFDWLAAGVDPAMVPLIRHARRSYSKPDEFPCISIRWVEDSPRVGDQDQAYITPDEMYVDMRLELMIDTDPSDVDLDDPDQDETGLGFSSALAVLALRALKDPEGELMRLWASGVSDRGRGEDPDSTNEEARLLQAVAVLYRVATEDPSVILAEGMNA